MLMVAATQAVHTTNLSLTLGTATKFENAIGYAGAVTLIGNPLNNTLSGGARNDRQNGSWGNDILSGGENDDTYFFGPATTAEADQVIELLNQGTDTLNFPAVTTDVALSIRSSSIQNLHTNRTLKLNAFNTFENIVGGGLKGTTGQGGV